jgi:hypothetical protein
MYGGLKGILSLLGKSGESVLSPATQARNIASGKQVVSPTTQARNLTGAKNLKAAKLAQAKSLQHATAKVDDLIRQGKLPTNVRREDLIRKMQQHLEREYERIRAIQPAIPIPSQLPGGNFTAFPAELIRKLGDKAVLAALGIGGAAGYYAGSQADDAVGEMEEETQIGPVKGYFKEIGFGEEEGNWGEPLAKLLMDIISPIPRYTDESGRE